MRIARPSIRGLMASALLACIALPGAVSAAAATPDAGSSDAKSSVVVGSTAVPKPDHVVMVMMENKGYDDILNNPSTKPQDQVPYIKSLEAQGASFTNSYGITHPSLPNYYSLLSASDIVKTNDYPEPSSVDTDNLPNQLVTHGYTFADYANQAKPTQWLRYKTTPGTAGNLNPMDKRQEQFPTTQAGFENLPTVSFYVGNGQQSMHDGTLAQGDAFIKKTFDSYIQWARTHNSLFVLTWDEDDFTPSNHIPTIMVGPMAKAGEYSERITHYNVLKTLLDMYGLDHINHTADPDVSTITDVWDTSQTERLRGMAGRCLENHQTNPAEPGELGLWHCEEAANQQWVRHGDGTIRNADKCLTATADGKTGLADCDGTPAQSWQPETNGSLLNPASGRCLTVPGSDIANGTPAELRDCDGTTSQKWIVPGYNAHNSLTVDRPSFVKPGGTATVTATYTNDVSPVALAQASANLTVPSGWTAKATSPTTVATLKPGQSVKTTWAVTAPADAKSGDQALSAQATYKNAKSSDEGASTIRVGYNPVDATAATPAGLDLVAGHSTSVRVNVTNNTARGTDVTVQADVPSGWTASAPQPVSLNAWESKTATFSLTPAQDAFGHATVTLSANGEFPTASSTVSATVGKPIMMVGETDASSHEFALSPNRYSAYPSTFPNDVTFTAGVSNPATDWSYIQPGPLDSWAKSQSHTFTLNFNLAAAPSSDLTFTAWLEDTHPTAPPSLAIGLNGAAMSNVQTPAGGGGGASSANNTKPSTLNVTLSAANLKAGDNTVTITTTGGSWMVYDAFAIRQLP
ncbi:alkaline phosphatase family protein [Streptomyces sp. NPDC058439]|uniref:alkaline phosphatase family protein n=1 Tax=Streptomyces sp. NPDC058439 TaxID=3346500 RepID=UPI003646096C